MKVLAIRNQPPWPLHYGGRLHCYELCRRLAERHELLLVAQHPCEVEKPPFNFDCRVAGDGPSQTPDTVSEERISPASRVEQFFGFDPAFAQNVLSLTRKWRPDVVLGMGYLSLAYLARLKGVPTVCDLQDDEALHRWRELLHGRMTAKWSDVKCLLAAALYERKLIRRADAVTVLSQADAGFCRWLTGHRRIECIPHGVDCEKYKPLDVAEDSDQIIFWGGLDFGPNVSAILFFAEKVWPAVLKERPKLRWTIVGWGSPAAIEPVRRLKGVEFTGYVEDIRPFVAKSAVAVVPMVSGAGIKNKIMEAWAMGKPVLCTPRALGDLPGEHQRNVWLGRSPEALRDGLSALLSDAHLRRRIGQAARSTAVEQCSWDRAAGCLERLCQRLIRGQGHTFPQVLPALSGEEAVGHAAP